MEKQMRRLLEQIEVYLLLFSDNFETITTLIKANKIKKCFNLQNNIPITFYPLKHLQRIFKIRNESFS